MYKASKLINPKGMFTLYHSLFMPYLCYCNAVWGNTYTSNVKCILIFILQKRFIQLLCGESRLAHTNNLFKERSLLKFPDLVIHKTGIIMSKLFADDLPKLLQSRFSKYRSVHNTRKKN